jgi:hypothetical protein
LTPTPNTDPRARIAESQMRPLTTGPLAVVGLIPTSTSVMSSASYQASYDPRYGTQLESARGHDSELDYACGLQFLDSNAQAFPSTEECAQLAMERGILFKGCFFVSYEF